MGEVYDKIFVDGDQYNFVKGKKNFKAELKKSFTEQKDQEAIDKYVDLVLHTVSQGQKFFTEKALPGLLRIFIGKRLKKGLLKYSDRTTLEVLNELTDNQRLIAVLCGQYGDYGLPPAESSWAIHCMVANHYFEGGAFPVGGSSRIFDTIEPVIEENGGAVYINAGVEEILIKNNKAVGVKMEDGKEVFAPLVISNAGILNTFNRLIPDSINKKFNLNQRLGSLKPSVAHMCLYTGLNASIEELGLQKANYWIYPSDDHDQSVNNFLADPDAEFPVIYISFPAAKDPDWSNRYPGKSAIDIITLAPYEWFSKWEGTSWMKRGDDYDALKEKFAERLLEALYKAVPSTKGKVEHYELSSPLSTQNFCNYEKGEIYGLSHTPSRFREKVLQPKTPIKNLLLTGQDIVTCGVAGALAGGMITASYILKKNLPKIVWREFNSREKVKR